MFDILIKGQAHLLQKVEDARVLASGDDHESSDEEGDPPGFLATVCLRNYCKDFKNVPLGGAGAAHQQHLKK